MPRKAKTRRPRPKLAREPLTATEARALIRACSSRAPTGVRNAALLGLMWGAGLRISECIGQDPARAEGREPIPGLYLKDLDADKWELSVLMSKGGASRKVAVHEGVWALLQRWIDRRKELGVPSTRPLFCTLKGGRMSGAYVRAMMRRMAKRAGIEKRVHPHGLRHSFASAMVDKGEALEAIQGLLGHRSLATTWRYVHGLNPKRALDAGRSFDAMGVEAES